MKKKILESAQEVPRGGNTKPLCVPNFENEDEFSKICEGRLWCFTDFNEDPPQFTDDMQYLGYEYEICPKTGTPHWQSFVYWKRKKRFNACRKAIKLAHAGFLETYKPINVRFCKGTFEQNVKYCSKDGKYFEFGEKPSPGARTDLRNLRDEMINGKSLDDIAMENPYYYHTYGRTLSKIEDLILRKRYRSEMTKGVWIYGPTGIGKSHAALSNYNPETHYIVPNDNGWWDAYKQQDIVVINDFRGEIKYNELLQLVDKWPFMVKRRNREPMPFTSKLVIITSSLHPKQIYHNRNDEDKLEQLLRRFDIQNLGNEVTVDDIDDEVEKITNFFG